MNSKAFELSTYLHELEQLVNIDSGSLHPAGIAEIAAFFKHRFADLGWFVRERRPHAAVGPCLEIVNREQAHYDLLLIGHMDTVFPVGTVKERPFRINGDKAFGPGVIDMKSGLLSMYHALRLLNTGGSLEGAAICVALNSDEEISSRYSRPWLEALAKKSRHALVLEPARSSGALVNKRKGIGRYSIEFTGIAAHAGVEPEKGASAISELCHWGLALQSMTDYEAETTVNVGIVQGGTAANVVAERATAEVDMRMTDLQAVEKVETLMTKMSAHPKTPGVKVAVKGGVVRPPMNPSEQTAALCRAIDQIAANLGIHFEWAATGGGSDANFTAALGVPTIDGLGPIGGGAHGSGEYLLIDSVIPRLKLLSDVIKHITK